MSTRTVAQHADWLGLTEPVGPFLTLPVLRRVWPGGLDRTSAPLRAEVRERVENLGTSDRERREFIEWTLRTLLRYGTQLRTGQAVPDTLTITLPEHASVLRPDFVLVGPSEDDLQSGRPRMLVHTWPAGTDPTAHVAKQRWAASPIDRMVAHCRSVSVELGLVTDGDRFTLVWAPRSRPVGRATWTANIFAEAAERTLLDSFTSVLGAKRFFSVQPDDQLEALLAEAADAQSDVTNQLGRQVRHAVELLVTAFSRGGREHGEGDPLASLDPHDVYEAACTIMMRLVFLLYAEERRLLPLGDDFYDGSYAISPIRQTLRDVADHIGNEEILEHSRTAWPRLLATFRAVYGGLSHDELRLPAYGGRLFDPDRYPFLEGRTAAQSWRTDIADPLPVDDRTVLGILTALQVLELREAGVTEARRLSFRSLDVEQIGHVYEGLLDHGARRLDETALGLIGKPGDEPEVPLSEFMEQAAKGTDSFVAWLSERTGRTEKQILTLLAKPVDELRLRRLRVACDNQTALTDELKAYAWLLRDDLRQLPTVYLAGSVYVTKVTARRDSGTEYTTKELAEEVVRHALEPLVYRPGPAEGADRADWNPKSSAELLALQICDPAVGSGAILTAACRYLADRLVEAWASEGATPVIASDDPTDDIDDVVVEARRAVAEQCLYGVDRDPMAVEMAKLSLWLVTMAKERPFSYLDHALRAGDSLLGITTLEQVMRLNLHPEEAALNFAGDLEPIVMEALRIRDQLEAAPVVAIRDVEDKERLHRRVGEMLRAVTTAADLVVGAAVSTVGMSKQVYASRLAEAGSGLQAALKEPDETQQAHKIDALASTAAAWLAASCPPGQAASTPLHWPLAFPEAILRGGFDAFVANPPYIGNKYWKERIGTWFQPYFERVLGQKLGKPDLIVLFFWRMAKLTRTGGTVGSLTTQKIGEVDSKRLLESLVLDEMDIFRAVRSRPWPGRANVHISQLWLQHGKDWAGQKIHDGEIVAGIGADIRPVRELGDPKQLADHLFQFEGVHNGKGLAFVLPAQHNLVELEQSGLVRPYISGDDLTQGDPRRPSRYVIDLTGTSAGDLEALPPELQRYLEDVVKPTRTPENLKPYKGLDERWWTFWNTREEMFRRVRERKTCIVAGGVAKYLVALELPSEWVYTNKVAVFDLDRDDLQTLLLSPVFDLWLLYFGGTLGTGRTMKTSAVVNTFPLPETKADARLGKRWQEGVLASIPEKGNATDVLNAVHDQKQTASAVQELRSTIEDIARSVLIAYGWGDLDASHDFHDTVEGLRWTVAPTVAESILERTVKLNYERHAEEVAAGKHAKDTSPRRRSSARKATPDTVGPITLFGIDKDGE